MRRRDRGFRFGLARALPLLGLGLVTACTDSPVPPETIPLQFAIQPSFSGPMRVPPELAPTRLLVELQSFAGQAVSQTTVELEEPLQPGAQFDEEVTLQVGGQLEGVEVFLTLSTPDGPDTWGSGPDTVYLGAGSTAARVDAEMIWIGPGAGAVRLELSPQEASLAAGEEITFEVSAYDDQDNLIEGAAPALEWSTDSPALLSHAQGGRWTASGGAGQGYVFVRHGPLGLLDSARVQVRGTPTRLEIVSGGDQTAAVGNVLPAPVVARILDEQDAPLGGESVSWEVITGEGSVTPASSVTAPDGRASADWTLGPAVGTQVLRVSVEGLPPVDVSATAVESSVAAVDVLPADATLDVGASLQFTATAEDRFGNPILEPEVTWTSTDETVLTVDATGRATGVAPGNAALRATVEGVSGQANVVVEGDLPNLVADSVWFVYLDRETGGTDYQLEMRVSVTNASDVAVEPFYWNLNRGGAGFEVAAPGIPGGGLGPRGTTVLTRRLGDYGDLEQRVEVTVDWQGLIQESDETDNVVAGTTPLYPAPVVEITEPSVARIQVALDDALALAAIASDPVNPLDDLSGSVEWISWLGRTTFTPGVGGTTTASFTAAGIDTIIARVVNPDLSPPSGPLTGADTLVVEITEPASQGALTLSAGGGYVCGLTTSGVPYCWGFNLEGQLGNGTEGTGTESSVPVPVDYGGTFVTVTTGFSQSCGLTDTGDAYCWGYNLYGQLGNGNDGEGANSPTPVAVEFNGSFDRLEAGGHHTCGLTSAGELYCWGQNSRGQLGNGTSGPETHASLPVRVAFEGTFVDVAAGSFHTCGLTAAGEAYCWGQNFQGQLGNGDTGSGADSPIPVRVDFAGSFASLSLGDRHSCGLTTGGEAWCWGDNPYGQVGDGTTVRAPIPVRVQFEGSFESVIAGNFHSCGLTSSGTAYCWGRNDEGRIGNGQAGSNELVPVPVAFEGSFVELTGGGAHTCGITSQGWAYCWGESDSGRLGNGGTADATVPVPVDPPLGLGS